MSEPRVRLPHVIAFCVGGYLLPCAAVYDPAKEYVESPQVVARYPDPEVPIATPAFAPGKSDFTSQDELMQFVDDLARRSPEVHVRIVGYSQEERAMPLLVYARASGHGGADLLKNGKPTVLVIGQQHGNEPAGGEAALALAAELAGGAQARILDRINVLIVPRGNPDGAHHFVRGLKNGADVNRDHLLQSTLEGRALGRVFVEYQPDVVLDCHEFGVKLRWFEKFQALQGYDALIQYATVSNLPSALIEAAERVFRKPLLQALDAESLRSSWYYTTGYDVNDRTVSMGGVVPDTGRNIAGLRNAISFLIETRGVGIGRAHFKRRVYTHLVAMRSILDSTAQGADTLLALGRRVRQEVAGAAGKGDLVVAGVATPARNVLDMIDPQSGSDKKVEVEWRSALEIDVKQKRSRPFGYVLAGSETLTASRLQGLGVSVLRLDEGLELNVERYLVTDVGETKKDDVRRNDEDGVADILRIATETEVARMRLHAGDYYVPLDQPLANVIVAALEPEPQSSYASNRLLTVPQPAVATRVYLPLYRLSSPLRAAMTMWRGR